MVGGDEVVWAKIEEEIQGWILDSFPGSTVYGKWGGGDDHARGTEILPWAMERG